MNEATISLRTDSDLPDGRVRTRQPRRCIVETSSKQPSPSSGDDMVVARLDRHSSVLSRLDEMGGNKRTISTAESGDRSSQGQRSRPLIHPFALASVPE